ncbi:hypothetical protein CVN68_20180 [Sphingomonas psychrotolerans]|uniref:Uncharacterized protein n=1 Tax=Sphingomonas psychrotolerans TaxID=1327635 RepID=A0A2K8MLV8_9SPHN|nr:hypothetical protein CVN68_20180 [Sphingomonas psychrotolerans]
MVSERNQPAAKAGVIKTTDWTLALAPEGGVKGEEIVAQATPEVMAKESRSFTGQVPCTDAEPGKGTSGRCLRSYLESPSQSRRQVEATLLYCGNRRRGTKNRFAEM